jgi:hypothetical protein
VNKIAKPYALTRELNYFRRKRNSRAVDGQKRSQSHHEKTYGFDSTRMLKLALYHSVGNLRQPEHTQDFSDEAKFC